MRLNYLSYTFKTIWQNKIMKRVFFCRFEIIFVRSSVKAIRMTVDQKRYNGHLRVNAQLQPVNWLIKMLNLDNLKNAAPVGCKSDRMSSVLFPIINKQNNKGQKEPNIIILLTGRKTSREIQFDVNIIYFAL